MKNSDYKIPPFSLVYNMYISGLYGASYFAFIAKNAIYFLKVYVYSICKKLERQIVGFCWRSKVYEPMAKSQYQAATLN
jgi:hypothetical protein